MTFWVSLLNITNNHSLLFHDLGCSLQWYFPTHHGGNTNKTWDVQRDVNNGKKQRILAEMQRRVSIESLDLLPTFVS